MKSISIFGVALSLLILSTASHAITLSWVGCGITKKAFMQELAVAYQKKTGIEITISGGGATKGIQSVTDHEADLGGSCRYRIEGEAPKSKVRFNPVAWDALIVAVHKSNPVDTISMAQLQQLYRGEIDNWRQLGGSDQPVELLVRNGKISGVGLTIRQLVFSDPEMDFPLDHTYKSSGPLEEAIEQNPNAVGMTGISSGRKRDFKILKLDGKEPSFDNIKTGSYMLYRPLFLLIDRQSANVAELDKFLAFSHSKEGREIIRKNGVVPYLEALSLTFKQREQWKSSRKKSQ